MLAGVLIAQVGPHRRAGDRRAEIRSGRADREVRVRDGKPLADLPLPATPIKPIPFHGFRQPALAAAITWKRFLDRWEAWRG